MLKGCQIGLCINFLCLLTLFSDDIPRELPQCVTIFFLTVNINLVTLLHAQARQLRLFQSQDNFWNCLKFVNKNLLLFEEISGKFQENQMQISACRVPSILKTVPSFRVYRNNILEDRAKSTLFQVFCPGEVSHLHYRMDIALNS